ncbi:MAG TPA: hypothetical protein VJZ32_12500 [Candidatus Bathyarchaeia archaeon]|nr:hypothetical protein [Candidatus Bathyarchaeia archaeon]HKM78398.1 hypothetical protein [Candidatus Bathyarchaeia archaeon]
MPNEVKFSCDICHKPISVYPPSSEYIEVIEKPCTGGDGKEFKVKCQNSSCGAENIRYWHRHHITLG